mmetsp:Transcript_9414/g.22240  ORF Transcript_9414/g.22240 Transcript_9414/m.22240 type:complete len:110 (+) Transcript_9414:14-343(+)
MNFTADQIEQRHGRSMRNFTAPGRCPPFELCTVQEDCWDSYDPGSQTSTCFNLALYLIWVGLALIFICEFMDPIGKLLVKLKMNIMPNRREASDKTRDEGGTRDDQDKF